MISLAVINRSSLPDAAVVRFAGAQQRQITKEFSWVWDTNAAIFAAPDGVQLAPDTWRLYLYDEPQNAKDAGMLGHHERPSGQKVPVGASFVRLAEREKESWTEIASHEVLEMLVDPWVNLLVAKGAVLYSLEVCDPVQGQSYAVDGVELANFVLPAWFIEDVSGPYDYRKNLKQPFSIAAGGYASTFYVRDGKLATRDVYGVKYAGWRKRARAWSRRDDRRKKMGVTDVAKAVGPRSLRGAR